MRVARFPATFDVLWHKCGMFIEGGNKNQDSFLKFKSSTDLMYS